jgi:hypothetical protein
LRPILLAPRRPALALNYNKFVRYLYVSLTQCMMLLRLHVIIKSFVSGQLEKYAEKNTRELACQLKAYFAIEFFLKYARLQANAGDQRRASRRRRQELHRVISTGICHTIEPTYYTIYSQALSLVQSRGSEKLSIHHESVYYDIQGRFFTYMRRYIQLLRSTGRIHASSPPELHACMHWHWQSLTHRIYIYTPDDPRTAQAYIRVSIS